jgi:hypothetical protein
VKHGHAGLGGENRRVHRYPTLYQRRLDRSGKV